MSKATTNQDVILLLSDAASAGDLAQVAICHRALGTLSFWSCGDRDAFYRASKMTVEEARIECERVIQEASDQNEVPHA